MERGGYDHAFWPTKRLLTRLSEIAWQLDNIAYGEARRDAVDAEGRYIEYEVVYHRAHELKQAPSPANMPKHIVKKPTGEAA